ncbi:MAG: carbamoyltransferase HypF [Methylovulum sp.]|nr:carbamoyltransferase HypF [Methylovulum sp.]
MSGVLAFHIAITGRVQGVGFRPFVSRLAHEFALAGWVRNHSGQVEIWVEGAGEALTAFTSALLDRAPPLAQPEYPTVSPVTPCGYGTFTIERSDTGNNTNTHIPPDYFVCDDCLAEMQNPAERRYRYPFINCTQCGPRYTLIDHLPYDRPNTAMASFGLCPACQAEYSNPLDRRYHAQPLACSCCGPSLSFCRPGYSDLLGNETALTACLAGLSKGLIVAVKGVGGYHLLCDATHPDPVLRLRERKRRPDKPFAVLVPWRGEDGLALVNQLADLCATEKHQLCSPLRPIVLVKKRHNSILTDAIAPGLDEVGLMLPYSPLHHLLANGYGIPLVATSANLSGEPVLTDNDEVGTRLGHVADAFLHHNRPIRRPADDSVFRRIAGKTRPVRMGRGLAPIERKLPFQLQQPLLAVGADLKNTVALGFRDRVVVSPHIGDLGSLRSLQVFEQLIADFQRLYDVIPQAIVCDAHPGYHSSHWAKRQGLPIMPVFHHHAHASALAGEHALAGQLLVFTWDGTGYGEDGTIWGGEALLGSPGGWHRAGSLRPFYLPGGDKASREPWRCALSVCWELGIDWPEGPEDVGLLQQVWERRINSPATSSVGRLFDAAATLIGIAHNASYEGHAAMRLEAIGVSGAEAIALPVAQNAAGVFVSDWGPLLPFLMDTRVSPSERSSVFHASLATTLANQAKLICKTHGISQVGLTGGVFQNRLLTEQAQSALEKLGFDVYLHDAIPSGDGGLSFGQIIEAGYKMRPD